MVFNKTVVLMEVTEANCGKGVCVIVIFVVLLVLLFIVLFVLVVVVVVVVVVVDEKLKGTKPWVNNLPS
jgi:hypothetical protein